MNELCAQIQAEKNYDKFEALTREVIVLLSAKESRLAEPKPAPAGTAHKLLHATATRTLAPLGPGNAETVEIHIAEAGPLYGEIRIENTFTDEHGNVLSLRPPARLEIDLHAPAQRFVRRPNERAD
jgi:hypothetical protein